jgi:ornithine carbamoyltransferase
MTDKSSLQAAMQATQATPIRHFLQLTDFSREELLYVLERARVIKEKFKHYEPHRPLHDRTLAMVFEKASTRTRVSFEAGMYQMGGAVIHLTTNDSQLGRSEPIEDTARVVSRMVDIVMIRTFEQSRIETFAQHSRVPVINGLTNEFHPCQILADVFTYIEHRGSLQGKIVTWIGDANNMAYTWIQAAERLGFKLHFSAPDGYRLDPDRLVGVAPHAYASFDDPHQACQGADLVTTDVWTSMGYEAENDIRKKAFSRWCVDSSMMARAKADAIFMHCLPAHRGEEVTAEVIDGPQSVVWDEAENRLHAQKALMEFLLLGHLDVDDSKQSSLG